MRNLHGLVMYVSSTATHGVVDSDTRLRFSQRGDRVVARYSGGSVDRGWLAGKLIGAELTFRYAQRVQRDGVSAIDGGRSICEVQRMADGRTRIVEHFTWTTRRGSGTNVFDEIDIGSPSSRLG